MWKEVVKLLSNLERINKRNPYKMNLSSRVKTAD